MSAKTQAQTTCRAGSMRRDIKHETTLSTPQGNLKRGLEKCPRKHKRKQRAALALGKGTSNMNHTYHSAR